MVNIAELENPKDTLGDSFFRLCALNVAKLQHLECSAGGSPQIVVIS